MAHHAPSPYAYLGLWRNPFGELTADERMELAVVDTQLLLEHLSHSRRVVQFVGDCGFGKTTHLLALRVHWPTAPLVYFPERGPRPRLPLARPLLVDEAQRMGWARRRELLRSEGPFALTTHADMSKALKRAGFEVLSVDCERPKTPAQLAEILNRRINASRLGSSWNGERFTWQAHAGPAMLDETLTARLLTQLGSNLRRIENHLYEELQGCVEEKRAWPPVN